MSEPLVITRWSATLDAGSVSVQPDGCRDLIVRHRGDAPPQLFLTSVDVAPRLIHNHSTSHYIGLRLQPGTHFAWERSASPPPHDQMISGNDHITRQWGAAVARSPQRADELLLDGVQQWAKPGDQLCREFFSALAKGDVGELELEIGERQLRRRLLSQTGRPPRFWRQLHRARRAALTLLSGTTPLRDAAQELGYADQAHMSRDIRRWFNITPGELRRRRDHFLPSFHAKDAFTSYSTK